MSRIFLAVSLVLLQIAAQAQQSRMLWDTKPAAAWMMDAYPMGNGRIGGMVFGGLGQERIQLNELSLWTGDEEETGAYQDLGDLFIRFNGIDTSLPVPADYRRQLDISRSVQQIAFTTGGVSWKREYFCSFPGSVMVLRFTASKKGQYNATIRLKDAHSGTIIGAGATLTMAGKLRQWAGLCSGRPGNNRQGRRYGHTEHGRRLGVAGETGR